MSRSLGLLALFAVLVAGCGGGSAATTTDGAHAQAVKFSECMRSHGIAAFPDPDASGSLTIDGVLNGPLVDTNRIPSANTAAGLSAVNAAMHTCGAVYAGQLGLTGP